MLVGFPSLCIWARKWFQTLNQAWPDPPDYPILMFFNIKKRPIRANDLLEGNFSNKTQRKLRELRFWWNEFYGLFGENRTNGRILLPALFSWQGVQWKLELADTSLAENLGLKDTLQKIWATVFFSFLAHKSAQNSEKPRLSGQK